MSIKYSFVLGGGLLFAAPAQAQIDPDEVALHQPYDIFYGLNNIGHVVSIASNSTNHPTGYAAGEEYWTWDSNDWPTNFRLVPVSTAPTYSNESWDIYDHETFDLSGTVGFPDVTVGTGDRFYEVSTVKDGPPVVTTQTAYLLVLDGTTPALCWYALDTHAKSYINPNVSKVRFDEVTPPAEDAVDVYLLNNADGDCPE